MNNQGFMTLSALVVMKLVFILAFGSMTIFYLINQKNGIDNICHQYLISSQKQLVDGNNQLMALNLWARTLQIKKKILEQISKASPPPVAAAAQAARLVVIANQYALKLHQETIKTKSNLLSKKDAMALKYKIKKKIGKLRYFWKNSYHVQSSISVFWNSTQIQVDQDDIAPTYKRGTNHWKTQGSQAYWSFNLHQILPRWLKQIVTTQKRVFGQCASHPHKGGYQWTPSIGEGRH